MGNELHVGHAQLGKLGCDPLVQLGSRRGSSLRKLAGQFIEACPLAFQLCFQLFQAAFAAVQFGQLDAQALMQFR